MSLVLVHLKITSNRLAANIGLGRAQAIYNILQGRNAISPSLAEKITTKYNTINYEWLLTGEGEMLKTDAAPVPRPQKSRKANENSTPQPLDGMLAYLQAENRELKIENKELNKEIGRLAGKLEGKDETISSLKQELSLFKKDSPTPTVRAVKRVAF